MLTATKNTNVELNKYRYGDGADIEFSNAYDRFYDRTAKDTTEDYREHLYDALSKNRRALGSDEYEDERRYESISGSRKELEARSARQYESKENAPKARRVMKKKMIPLVACYFLMVAVVVALIVVNVSGTAWEAESIVINPNSNILPEVTASAENPSVGAVAMNTVATENGTVLISLSPYPVGETYEEDTNWFDKVCDFISNLAGG